MKITHCPSQVESSTGSRLAHRLLLNFLPKAIFTLVIMLSGCKTLNQGKNSGSTNDSAAEDFTIAVIPDTQNYMAENGTALRTMFYKQIEWIKANREKENIVYVAGLGDITSCGDQTPKATKNSLGEQWDIAAHPDSGYYALEKPLPGLPHGIPYGLTVGNHDQLPLTRAFRSKTTNYNIKFGRSHFAGRSYWGGAFTEPCKGPENPAPCNQEKNDNHYDFFSVNGQKYIVVHIEYDDPALSDKNGVGPYDDKDNLIIKWAAEKISAHKDHKAIIVSHSVVDHPGTFTQQGARIYNGLKSLPNVFLMFGGHVAGSNEDGLRDGEAYRQRTFRGNTIKAFLSNYQGRPNGGNGLMRLYTISPSRGIIKIRTINPYTGIPETDGGSEFIKPLYHSFTSSRTADFDNDGKSQIAVFDAGTWKIQGVNNSSFGAAGDIAIPADYDGDGKTELAYYRPSDQAFVIQGKAPVVFGKPADIPVPGDYQDESNKNANDTENTAADDTDYKKEKADGLVDIAVWRPSTGEWLIKDQTLAVTRLGKAGDVPVPADYDGDGKVDYAVFTPSSAQWQIKNNSEVAFKFGEPGDIPVPGDYNRDGIVDVATFRPSNRTWYVRNQTDQVLKNYQSGDVPVPGDYNGDGKTDMALYRPSSGMLFIGNQAGIATGIKNGKPLNLPYHIQKFFSW